MSFWRQALEAFASFGGQLPVGRLLPRITVFLASAGRWNCELKAGPRAWSTRQLSLCPGAPYQHRVNRVGAGRGLVSG